MCNFYVSYCYHTVLTRKIGNKKRSGIYVIMCFLIEVKRKLRHTNSHDLLPMWNIKNLTGCNVYL